MEILLLVFFWNTKKLINNYNSILAYGCDVVEGFSRSVLIEKWHRNLFFLNELDFGSYRLILRTD